MNLIAVDIGSTWTKAALFAREEERVVCRRRSAVPTTTGKLSDGFDAVVEDVRTGVDGPCPPIVCSSSAKGGLAVAAVGIVPDLTLKMAHRTALSAGARIEAVFSYELTSADRAALETLAPDIILFTGGTDGGNTEFIKKNVAVLRELTIRPHIVFAGNRTMADFVSRELSDFPVVVAENILPDLNTPNPEPARAAIREIFIGSITHGKGLDDVSRRTTGPVLPTPLVVYEYVKIISETVPGRREFCLVDIGGATTDVYSTGGAGGLFGGASSGAPPVVLKGPPEPAIRRTVEGDLGMRVSAAAVLAAREGFLRPLCSDDDDWTAFCAYARSLPDRPDFVTSGDPEARWDRMLAAACLTGAIERHAGRAQTVYTSDGAVTLQSGINLQGTELLLLSGGFLSSVEMPPFIPLMRCERLDSTGRAILLPASWQIHRDAENTLTLFAGAARVWPEHAALSAPASRYAEVV
ncbi:MAG: glutamate mutase [Spirochaetaceae bacterium]|nr:MAG: glutamate mutase [Spirochaetaceae bacterium]